LWPNPNRDKRLSVRKLVLETAKYNVLTAYPTREAVDIFQLFPNMNVAVLVMSKEIDCERIATHIKETTDKIVIVALTAHIGGKCASVDHMLSSHEPEQLIALMRSLVGDPR
jgi:DNA-binding response OmpR family regulator